ncbi:alpha-aminoadipic semialdehyde synthase, mitochondrial [Bombyx mandarina]|uniref:Saccharopine dehydrogenase (NAD(+), L-glutamate-forming) n=2 Tax=Bombyx TaxID=7090 RepID=A0A8R1WK16_BOMMO|nr:alpha-aminoadipic semialdehyde synthase, mitochondrial [Bombyx mori]XP_028034304.1 alpha-aminoadipic semialdehyde synthase, mitochondrial [Bombyx mandarina]
MLHKSATLRSKGQIIQNVAFYSSTKTRRVIAIRREDQSVWERRAPFSPSNVKSLVREGVKVIVQPSNRRAYPMQSYINAGAIVQEDISEASVIFGVKQTPIDLLIPNKTYCFFSHTIKAQEANMPMLDAMLAKNIRLIDYEKLMDDKGNRVVAFGKYAGVAGMVNILHGLGLRLLALGHHTPFMHIGPAHNYRNSSMARQAIRDAGYEVALGMMPKSLGPLTFVFTGSGNVSQGSQEIFQELPHEYVPPEMLRKVAEHGSPNKIYGCEVRRRHHLVRKNGGGYDADEYEEHPERYISTFAQKIAPYTSVLVNCIYWAVDSPKLLTIPDAKHLIMPAHTPWLPKSIGAPALPHRMLAICDISADPGGSIEFMNECTTIDTPFCLYDADRNKDTKSFKGAGVLVCSIDNMPTQLPRESTDFFGDLLYPYAEDIMKSDATKPLEEHKFSSVVHGSIITSNGRLTPSFEYINELRMSNTRSRHKVEGNDQQSPIVILGSGLVSAPVVEYLSRDKNIAVTVASAVKEEADALAEKYGVSSEYFEANDEAALKALTSKARLVISLLPYGLHGTVAKACLNSGAHLVTASYVRPEVQELHKSAKEAGLTFLNEVGLDPGIDHLLALECIHNIQSHGGRIDSFVSYCGGLPAPEFSDNALRYKFSWNPRGVLLNTISSAKYLSKGQIVEVLSGGELMSVARELDFLPGFAFEGFPNRDSTIYSTLYGIEEAHTMFRGTIRYKGFAETMKALQLFGLVDPNSHPSLHPDGPNITWRQFACELLGLLDQSIFYDNLKSRAAEQLGPVGAQAVESLGLLSDSEIVKCGTPLDTISHYLSKKLQLDKDETDFVVLRHELGVTWSDGKKEKREVTMTVRGDPASHTAMARTVGLPTAIAAKMVLDGEIQERGVVLPFAPVVYKSLLSRLRSDGITAKETSRPLN